MPSTVIAPATPRPVFVDTTGRRTRAVRLAGRLLGAGCVAYVAMVLTGVGSSAVVGPMPAVPFVVQALPGAGDLRGPLGTLELPPAPARRPVTAPRSRAVTARATPRRPTATRSTGTVRTAVRPTRAR